MDKFSKDKIIDSIIIIQKKRKIITDYKTEINKIRENVEEEAEQVISKMEDLKKYMADKTMMNVKIGDQYYTLTQRATDVGIEHLEIDIESK